MSINRKVEYTKIRQVKDPNRAHSTDAGTDFFIPEMSPEFVEVLKEKNKNNKLTYDVQYKLTNPPIYDCVIGIPPGEQIMIPSGIKVWIHDKQTYLQATNKSGVASQYHLDVMANTIDANYQGEVHINLCNNGNTTIFLQGGQKIVQFIHKQYIDTEWSEITNDEYNAIGVSDRGEGGFNSTGNF